MAMNALIIAGPTASGKSSLAQQAAYQLNGEIINADSLQVYKDLYLLSARPTPAIHPPHHLYGVLSFDEKCTAAWWLNAIKSLVKKIEERGKKAIIVGGTGLYLRTLTHGLVDLPSISQDVKERVLKIYNNTTTSFFDHAVHADPLISEYLSPKDVQRLQRALMVFYETGRSLFSWHAQTQPTIDFSITYCVLTPNRTFLDNRIKTRIDQMFEQGVIEEVLRLNTLPISQEHMLLKAIGVREITDLIEGKISTETAKTLMFQKTRQYAKRQQTWFRHQVTKKIVLESPDIAKLMEAVQRDGCITP